MNEIFLALYCALWFRICCENYWNKMVNTGLQVIGFCIGLLGFILSVITTFLPAWQKNDIQGRFNVSWLGKVFYVIFLQFM